MNNEAHSVMNTMNVWVNPLLISSLDSSLRQTQLQPADVSASELLRDILKTTPAREHEAYGAVLARCQRASALDCKLSLVPSDAVILRKVVFPLRSAKLAYVLADYLACIALSGTTGEMIACLTLDLRDIRLRERNLTETLQRQLFGGTFEELSQSRRVAILQALGIWSEEQVAAATKLRKLRNAYLHRLSNNDARMECDAEQAYCLALELAAATVSIRVGQDGKLAPGQHLTRYVRRKATSESSP